MEIQTLLPGLLKPLPQSKAAIAEELCKDGWKIVDGNNCYFGKSAKRLAEFDVVKIYGRVQTYGPGKQARHVWAVRPKATTAGAPSMPEPAADNH